MSDKSKNILQQLMEAKLSRRSLIRDLGAMTAGATAASLLPVGIVGAQSAANAVGSSPVTDADDITLPEGFTYQVVIKRGDVFTRDGKTFGDNNDWQAWMPLNDDATEGLLIVNNEYVNPYLLYGYESMEEGGDTPKTAEQVRIEKEHVGVSIVHIRLEDGRWVIVTDSDYAMRWDATGPNIALTGPARGADSVGGATEVVGTLANCAGGTTPWGTYFSCEEDFYVAYGYDSVNEVDLGDTFRWLDDSANAQRPEHYGWAVEIDPIEGTAVKHTALGRFLHEAIAIGVGKSGKAVIYMTDDDDDRCLYKFISEENYNPDDRAANKRLFEKGTLYAADFRNGEWIPMVWAGNEEVLGDPEEVDGYTIASQADVLTYTHECAMALGGTRTDRPEGIAMHPETGHIFVAFTNNNSHGNVHGHITDIVEDNDDFESLTFNWDVFATGGRRGGFSSPDNLRFDNRGNLWMCTDVSTSRQNTGVYSFMGNNALFFFPTDGENFGKGTRVMSGPVHCEFSGIAWHSPNMLFLTVQHPGEATEPGEPWTSHWPDGGDSEPRSAVVAIMGPFDQI
jgi:uncharacterized protein